MTAEESGMAWREQARAGEVFAPTVPHALELAAAERPARGITLLPDDPEDDPETRTYAQLRQSAARVGAAFAARGVARGERVLLVLPTGWPFLECYFGLQMIGAVPVPGYPPAVLDRASSALERLVHIASDAGCRLCVTQRELLPLLGSLAVRDVREVIDVEALRVGDLPERLDAVAAPDDLAVIQYTSGSTGDPKGVALSHARVLANCHAVGQATEANDDDVMVSWLPLYHDLGLFTSLTTAVYWRIPMVLMSPLAFLIEPARWLDAFSHYRGTVAQAPTFAYARCLKRVPERWSGDLSSWRIGLVTAEPVDPEVMRSFTERFHAQGLRRDAIVAAYGLAECTAGVTFPRAERPRFDRVDAAVLAAGRAEPSDEDDAAELPSEGAPLPGHELRIVGDHGDVLGERVVGEVQLRGASMMIGYFGRPDETAASFQDGWFRTGDLGYLADGELYLTGRSKELLIVRGVNHHPADIERAAESVDGIRTGCVVAFGEYDADEGGDRLVLVCEVRGATGRDALDQRVREAVAEATGLRPAEVLFVPPGTVPKTPSGKRQRGLTRQRWRDGELAPRRTGKVELAGMMARSTVGLLLGHARRFGGRVPLPRKPR